MCRSTAARQATFVRTMCRSTGRSVLNTVTELVAGDHTVLSHYMIEREHKQAFNISTLRIQQGRSANVASHSVLLGGALVRNNVHPVLAGEGGECLINGLFIGNGRQHLDNYMLVEHASPHCGSRQFYNGILDGHAHGVFHGRIIVHKDAQKTDAKQTNRNLLLSDDAQIDTKPQLEIYADDVKCTHGATIGQIEENALFYLRSRGIDESVRAQAPALRLRQRVPRPHESRAPCGSMWKGLSTAVCSRWPTLHRVRRQGTAPRIPEETGRKSDDHGGQEIAQRVPFTGASRRRGGV